MRLPAIAVLMLCAIAALHPYRSAVLLDESDTISSWTGAEAVRKSPAPKCGAFAARWKEPEKKARLMTTNVIRDWSPYRLIAFWMYASEANGSSFVLTAASPGENGAGDYYIGPAITIDWRGWKHVQIPFTAFKPNRKPAGFSSVTGVTFNANGYGAEVKPGCTLIIDRMLLADDENTASDCPGSAPSNTDELIKNPSMNDTGEKGWPAEWVDFSWGQNTRTLSQAKDASGNAYARMTIDSVTGGWIRIGQKISLTPGKTYRASVRIKSDKPDLGMRFGVMNQEKPFPEVFSESIVVDDNWNEYSFIFDCTAKYDNLYFWAGTTTKAEFCIDNASIIELVSLESDGAPITGNLVVNGSFEGGADYRWGIRHRSRKVYATTMQANAADARAELMLLQNPPKIQRVDGGVHGAYALSIEMPPQTYCMMRSVPFTANYGRKHQLRVNARKTGGSVRLDIGVGSDKNEFALKRTVKPTEEWASYDHAGEIKINTKSRYYMSINIAADDEPATVFLDGISLVEADKPVFSERYPAELYISSDTVGNLFTKPEASARISLFGIDKDIAPAVLSVTISDVFGGRSELSPKRIDPKARTAVIELPLAKRPSENGIFKVAASLRAESGADIAAPCEYIFTVIPDLSARTEHDMPFGIHADAVPEDLDMLWKLGFRWMRFHDGTAATSWWTVEQTRGTFNFCDEAVDRVRNKGFRIMSMLNGTPLWAAPQQSGNFIPSDTAAWQNYVRTVMSHYKGIIDAYEVQNEPFYNWLKFTNAQYYVDLLDYAHAEAKKNGARTIGLCASTHDRTWPTAIFAAGGLNRYDIFSFHGYVQEMPGGSEDHLTDGIAYFRDEAKKNGGAIQTMWDTEGGSRSYASWYDAVQVDKPPLSHNFNIKHLVASYVMRQALGVEKFFLYTAHAGRSPRDTASYSILEHDRSAPKPPIAAIPFLFEQIYGCTIRSSEFVNGVRFVTYQPLSGGKLHTVAWSTGSAVTIQFTAPLAVTDVMGNKRGLQRTVIFGDFPYYLESDAAPQSMIGSAR